MMKSKDEIFDEYWSYALQKDVNNENIRNKIEDLKLEVFIDIRDVLDSIQNELVNIQNLQFLSKEQKAMRKKYMKKLYEDNKND